MDATVAAGDDVLCPCDLKAVNRWYNKGSGHFAKGNDDRNEDNFKVIEGSQERFGGIPACVYVEDNHT